MKPKPEPKHVKPRPRREPSHVTYVPPISIEEALEDAREGIFYVSDHGNQRRRVQARVRRT